MPWGRTSSTRMSTISAQAFCSSTGNQIVDTWAAAEQHEKALAELKLLELPVDAKIVEGFGITVGIAKNGAKRVRRL